MQCNQRQLAAAIAIAATVHARQIDKRGEAYILHPLEVMRSAREAGLGLDYQIIGALHDVLEDGKFDSNSLVWVFPLRILDALRAITRLKGEEYFDYVRRCGENEIARRVKIFDLRHNMSSSRDFDGRATLLERYEKALEILEGEIDAVSDDQGQGARPRGTEAQAR